MNSKRVYRASGMLLDKVNGVWNVYNRQGIHVVSAKTLVNAKHAAFGYVLACVRY